MCVSVCVDGDAHLTPCEVQVKELTRRIDSYNGMHIQVTANNATDCNFMVNSCLLREEIRKQALISDSLPFVTASVSVILMTGRFFQG